MNLWNFPRMKFRINSRAECFAQKIMIRFERNRSRLWCRQAVNTRLQQQ